MYLRIKQLRKILNMTQREFADALNVKRSTISTWEAPNYELTNRSIINICEKFNINEEWLRTGNGPIFKEPCKEEKLAEWVNNLNIKKDDAFKKRFINVLSELNDEQWELLADMTQKLYQEQLEDTLNNNNTDKSDN